MSNPIKRSKSPLNNDHTWLSKARNLMPRFIRNYETGNESNPQMDLQKVSARNRNWERRRSDDRTPHLTDEMLTEINTTEPYLRTRQIENPDGGMIDQVINTEGGRGNRIDYIPTRASYNDTNYNISGDPNHMSSLTSEAHTLGRRMVGDSLGLVNRGMGAEAVNLYGDNLGQTLRDAATPQEFSRSVYGILSNDGTDNIERARDFKSGWTTNPATNISHGDYGRTDNSLLTQPNKIQQKLYDKYIKKLKK